MSYSQGYGIITRVGTISYRTYIHRKVSMLPDKMRTVLAFAAALALVVMISGCASRVVVGRAAEYAYEEPAAAAPNAEPAPAPAPKPEPEPAAKPAPVPEPVPAPAVVKETPPTEPEPAVSPRSSRRREPAADEGPAPYEMDMSFGGFGLSQGYFDTPVSIAVDDEENIFVVDQGNYRIQKFDRYGIFRYSWGRQGLGDGEFEVVDVAGTPTLRMTGIFEFSRPLGILFDKDDARQLTRITVVDTLNNRIQRFLVTRFEGDLFPDELFVMLQGGGQIPDPDLKATYEAEGRQAILDPVYITEPRADAFMLAQFLWGGLGFSQGQLNNPAYLCRDEDGMLFVSDTDNARVQQFNVTPLNPVSDATFYREFGNELDLPEGNGRLNAPTAIVYDNSGYGSILVLDELREGGYVVQRYDRDTNFLGIFTKSGGGPGELRHPVSMAINPFDNNVFITDAGHRKVMVYNSKGEFIFSFGGEELVDPRGIAVMRNNYVYVTDANKNMVYRYIPR